MNVLMLLAQGAMNMADSLATANPVLTFEEKLAKCGKMG